MSLLRSLFGPSKAEVWRILANRVEGRFIEKGFFAPEAVQAAVGDWIITLDTYTQGDGKTNVTYTRLRAPYVNPAGFQFRIYRASIFSGLGSLLGMQDIEVGHMGFDRDFVVQANSEWRVKSMLAEDRIRRLIQRQPQVMLQVKDDEGWFGAGFPDGVDELYFQARGVMKDLHHLESLFALFSEMLHYLGHMSPAYEDDVDLHIGRLRAPGGTIETNRLRLWSGDEARRDAAEALGRLGDPKAVPVLAAVLGDSDDIVRAKAIDSLAAIAHEKAVRPLIPLLGDFHTADGRTLHERAAAALRGMGEGSVVDAVQGAFRGDHDTVRSYDGPYRSQILRAFEEALDGMNTAHAARALVAMRATESLGALRQALRVTGTRSPSGLALAEAVKELEARAALPRPASAADQQATTLPSPAEEPGPDKDTLPKASEE